MFVIDPKGLVRYNGAIDDKPSTDPASLKGARNFVQAHFPRRVPKASQHSHDAALRLLSEICGVEHKHSRLIHTIATSGAAIEYSIAALMLLITVGHITEQKV
jgi:hypothetical protein